MSNTITNVMGKILARGVLALRQNAIGPRTVNRDYENAVAQSGNVINVPIPSAIAARAVTPAVTFAANVDSAPTVALVTLDHWMEAPFQMHDNDWVSTAGGENFVPMQASEAVKSLGNDADAYLWGKHVGFFGYVGDPGAGLFNGSLTNAGNARKTLNIQLAPDESRSAILDPTAETYLLMNSQILQFDTTGSREAIVDGSIGRKLGFNWYMDQNIPSYTPGTGWATGYTISSISVAIGDTTLKITNTTASGSIKVGDVFTLAGYQYVVTVTTTFSATVPSAISIYPALKSNVSAGIAMTVIGTAYTANLAYNKYAMAWASRPLSGIMSGGNTFQAPNDPVSGVALRLELSRQYKQDTWSFDYLAGANIIRPELGVKLLG